MAKADKYNIILDTLETLLKQKSIEEISVSEIAKTAGIAKGSIYYYFESKDEILFALIERSYKEPVEVAHNLAMQTEVAPIKRMAMIFQACRSSSKEFLAAQSSDSFSGAQQSLLHQKYINYMVSELKPVLAEIIYQGRKSDAITMKNAEAFAEITLLVLTVKLDNTICPSSSEDITNTIRGLIKLLENSTPQAEGCFNFLLSDIEK